MLVKDFVSIFSVVGGCFSRANHSAVVGFRGLAEAPAGCSLKINHNAVVGFRGLADASG